jgi:hypothetical protein
MAELKKPTHQKYKSLNIGHIINLASERRNFRIKSNRFLLFRSQHTSPGTSSKVKNSEIASPEGGVLSTLRSRKNQKSPEISPTLAVEVVKDYILPLFKSSVRHKRDQDRIETFSLNTPTSPSDLKNEFLLSERILKEKQELELKCENLENSLKLAVQEKVFIESEVAQLKNELNDLQSKHELVLFNVRKDQGYYHYLEESCGLTRLNNEKLLISVKRLEKENHQLRSLLSEEKQLNDIRLFKMFSLTIQIVSAIILRNLNISVNFYCSKTRSCLKWLKVSIKVLIG